MKNFTIETRDEIQSKFELFKAFNDSATQQRKQAENDGNNDAITFWLNEERDTAIKMNEAWQILTALNAIIATQK